MNRDRSTMIHDADVFEADLATNTSGDLRVIMEDVCMRALHEAFLFPQPATPKEARARKFNSRRISVRVIGT